MNSRLQNALRGPLGNLLKSNNVAKLMATSTGLRKTLKNNIRVIELIYTEIKKAFFFRAFVLEFSNLLNRRLNDGNNNDLLAAVLSERLGKQSTFIKLDKTLSDIIEDGVKKIKNGTLLALLRKDPHFKSNPDAVFDTLRMNKRDVSGKRTLHIVRSMLGGEKPISYINLNTKTFKLNSPIAKIVNLGNQSFDNFKKLNTNKSVRDFLIKIKLKNTNVQNILMNNIGVYRGTRREPINMRTRFPLLYTQANNTPTRNNTSSLSVIMNALKLNQTQIKNFISKQYPNYNKKLVKRSGFMTSNQYNKTHAAAAAREKGKMPVGFNKRINYSKLFK